MNDKCIGDYGAFAMATIDGFSQYGLTKREYYSAMAMQGILTNSSIVPRLRREEMETIAKASIVLADSLVEQLDKEGANE